MKGRFAMDFGPFRGAPSRPLKTRTPQSQLGG